MSQTIVSIKCQENDRTQRPKVNPSKASHEKTTSDGIPNLTDSKDDSALTSRTPPILEKQSVEDARENIVGEQEVSSSVGSRHLCVNRKPRPPAEVKGSERRGDESVSREGFTDAVHQVYSEEILEVYGPEEVAAPIHPRPVDKRKNMVDRREISVQTCLRKINVDTPKNVTFEEFCQKRRRKVCNPRHIEVQVGPPYYLTIEDESESKLTPESESTHRSQSNFSDFISVSKQEVHASDKT